MSQLHGGDIFGVPSPTQLVDDCQQADFTVMGGYAYDDDVSMVNDWSEAHVQALQVASITFFPIITLRNSTLATSATLIGALKALGAIGGPVGWDREGTTAVPSQATMTTLVGELRVAGYGPMIGYRWPWGDLEPWYASLMDYLWAAVPGGPAMPPAGAQAVQYGQQTVNGTAYDLNTFDGSIFDPPAPPPPPATIIQEDQSMIASYTTSDGSQKAIFSIDSDGNVYQDVQDKGAAKWSRYTLSSSAALLAEPDPAKGGGITVDPSWNGQQHAWWTLPDGHLGHWWYTTQGNTEII